MMKAHIAELLLAELPDGEIQRYSGRGMYGNETTAIVTSVRDLRPAWEAVCRDHPELTPDVYDNIRSDNMGMDYVWY
jgi:hypothetical protein